MPGIHYELRLEFPDLRSSYRGSIRISGDLPSPGITLDAVGLAIVSIRENGKSLPFTLDPDQGRLSIEGIGPSTQAIDVEFSGSIEREKSTGIYQTPLGDGIAITTHLEPSAARRVFPCFDRPDVKATFGLEVEAPTEFTVISNVPFERRDELPGGRSRTRFPASPPMATYLFYLGIGPFEERERSIEGIRTISATARGLSGKTEAMLEETARAVRFFGEYYGVPFPLPKMHLVGIPKFLAGAMENWGAIVASEPILLVEEGTSLHTRMGMASVIAHEVAHQWFGNFVTMRTWDDLWLNEGFATFASYEARAALHPEWDSWEAFQFNVKSVGLVVDSLPATHPIHVTVTDPSRAPEFFDDISYCKGASVLRMIDGYVGEKAFRQGVSQYLRAHAWGNAESADLWTAIATASGEPVDRILPEWVLRPGYPLVTVEERGTSLHLTQRRFALAGAAADGPWPIPLRLEVDGAPQTRLMEGIDLEIPVSKGADVLVDPGRSGFYRVRYKGRLGRRVHERYPTLPPIDRLGFQSDIFAFLLAGEVSFSEYLEALRLGESETAPSVISQLFDALTWIRPVAKLIPAWEETYRRIFTIQGERLGPVVRPGEPASTTALRDQVGRARVALDDAYAQELRKDYPDAGSVAPELREAVYAAYAATAGPEEYAVLLRHLREAPPGLEGRRVAGALGFLRQEDWLLECLNLIGSREMELAPWARLLLTAVWLNAESGPALWRFLSTSEPKKFQPLQTGGGSMAVVLQHAIPVVGLSQPEEIRRFLEAHSFSEGEEGAKKGLAMLDVFERVIQHAKAAGLEVNAPPRVRQTRKSASRSTTAH